jgi:hypothetical protein
MHRTFNENVFTIEDDGFFRDKDVLVVSTVPKGEAVIALEDSIEAGKNVRVTGVVHPYDRGMLECAYGPLQVESREGHSFTKNPVLVIDRTVWAKAEPPVELEKPIYQAPPPPPAPAPMAPPAPAPIAPPAPEPERVLPKTAGGLPILGLAGLLALGAGFVMRRYRAG